MAESKSARLEAIVLAAGAGRRFGGGKLRALFKGRALIEGALAAAFAAPVRTVSVAIGDDPALIELIEAFAAARGETGRLRLIPVPDADEGIAASLRAAVAALPAEGALVFLGDMPSIPTGLAADLAAALDAGTDLAAPFVDGRRGHPVLFGRAWFPRLLALSGDTGGQAILTEAGDRLVRVETDDPGALFDVDRREDLA
jgi:molybdenum cofactor cytidylyltransferase